MNAPRSINSTKPFVSTAREYVSKGWGVLPLPERQKEQPPTGYTGRAGKFADDSDLTDWLADVKWQRGNVAVRVGNMITANDGGRFEVIGIDVDNYEDKKGGKELARFEAKYGVLPDTWISTSRSDGISGIRFYLVPYGYGFRGKASDGIDIVQRVHRYAIVYPSWHPKTNGQYFWYAPGNIPDGQSFSTEIPACSDLPLLPDGWIDFLTRNRTADADFGDGRYGIDLDVSNDELKAWVAKHFNPPLADEPGGMCRVMKEAVAQHISKIESSASNHDTLTAAHWNILHLVCEGHSGWQAAIEEVDAVWIKDIAAKDKRPLDVVGRERGRSFNGTLRKIKAKADSFAAQGISFFGPETCMTLEDVKINVGDDGEPPHWLDRVPLRSKGIDPANYDKNDTGMAKMFRDRVRDNVRYLSDYKAWIIYDGKEWHLDQKGNVGDLFHRVCVIPCKKTGLKAAAALDRHLSSGGTRTDAIGKPLHTKVVKLLYIAEHYGNDAKVRAMLNRMAGLPAMDDLPDVGMSYRELNCNPRVLAMPNGKVILLDEPGKPKPNAKGFKVIDNKKEYFTTLRTACEFKPSSEISSYEKRLWTDFLDRFLPDKEYRRDVQKVLGYMLIGGNPARKSVWLYGPTSTGKSTMLGALEQTLHDYGATFQPNAVLKEQANNLNPELGNLLFKRGIFTSELGGQRISAEVFKQVTGCDTVTITRKRANEQISGRPHFMVVVATNNPPNIADLDEATVRRIIVCPFETQVSAVEDDKSADVRLARDARHAILNWLVLGYRSYVREGLDNLHPKIVAASKDFVVETSDIAGFLTDIIEQAPEDVRYELLSDDTPTIKSEKLWTEWTGVTTTKLYSVYVQDCMVSNRKPMHPNAFGRKVCGVYGTKTRPTKVDGKQFRYYIGLKWKNEAAMNQYQA